MAKLCMEIQSHVIDVTRNLKTKLSLIVTNNLPPGYEP